MIKISNSYQTPIQNKSNNLSFGISDKLMKKTYDKRFWTSFEAQMAFQNAPEDEEIVKKLNRAYFSASRKYKRTFNLVKAKLAKTNRVILDLASVKK